MIQRGSFQYRSVSSASIDKWQDFLNSSYRKRCAIKMLSYISDQDLVTLGYPRQDLIDALDRMELKRGFDFKARFWNFVNSVFTLFDYRYLKSRADVAQRGEGMQTDTIGYRTKKIDFDLCTLSANLFLILSFFVLLDPFYTGYGPLRVSRDIGPLKYVPIFLGYLGFLFYIYGISNRGNPDAFFTVLKKNFWVFASRALVISGSVYAQGSK